MIMKTRSCLYPFLLLIVGFSVLACRSSTVEPTIAPSPFATRQAQTATLVPVAPSATPGSTSEPTPTLIGAGVSTPLPLTPTSTETATAADGAPSYRVVFVDPDDVLNVRSGPGVSNPVVGSLVPGTESVEVTGDGQLLSGSLWVPIVSGSLSGWVNSRFLTENVDSQVFCADGRPLELIEELKTLVNNRDGEALAEVTNVSRGLRVRRHWWNLGLRFEGGEISSLFTSSQIYDWGVADGSGEQILGSFSQIVLPLLDRDLSSDAVVTCNEIEHGGTAGLVQLPLPYEGINYYSVYRPAGLDDNEFDWGSWAVGLETWQGRYFVSFLVHFEWEI